MLRRDRDNAKRISGACGQEAADKAPQAAHMGRPVVRHAICVHRPRQAAVIIRAMISGAALPRTVAAAACAVVLLLASAVAAPLAAPPLVPIGQPVPDFKMTGLNGPSKSLTSFRGRPLIINVWASWCSPCRKEAASLELLAWSEQGAPYTIIGISTDDERSNALAWLRQSNATLSHFIDSAPHWPLEKSLGASSIPLTVLVDAKGRVVGRFRGARDWSSAESVKLIEQTFAEATRGPTRKP
jgi:peroxiredoxin